jgi:hypothetical protein
MKGNRAVITAAVVVVVLIAGWWLFRRGSASRIDLVEQFGSAEKSPAAGSYPVADVALAGDTKKAIATPPDSRLTWHVRVPEDGWLRVSVGLKPEAWDKEGDGVYFLVGVSDGRAFEQLFTEKVNPFKNPADRRWIPVMVDLSAYAGEDMSIIFNTRQSGPNEPADARNDLPVWGAPEIVTR